jgi:glycosyltransferase involved in cell wall biosynthesis
MVIGVDGNEANVQHRVGVSIYTYNLLSHFREQASAHLKFIVYLRDQPLKSMPQENHHFKYRVVQPRTLWSRIALPMYLALRRDIDVFFSPAHYAPAYCPVPTVVTIHDLAYKYFPNEFLQKDLYKLNKWTEQSVKKAAHVIAVSKNTKKDVEKFYEIPQEKISVVYNGFEHETFRTDESTFFNPYILYVGTLQPRKNLPILISAFNEFHHKHPDYQLRIAGRRGWMYDAIFKTVVKLKLEKDVIFEGYVTNERRHILYRNAFCFVMPSLYEGFNMPIVEAMATSTPVISSDSSCLPEVGGDACLYFDPTKPFQLVERLEKLLADTTLRTDLIERGRKQAARYSWTACATHTLDILKQTAHDKNN